jgi:hypothetical protein
VKSVAGECVRLMQVAQQRGTKALTRPLSGPSGELGAFRELGPRARGTAWQKTTRQGWLIEKSWTVRGVENRNQRPDQGLLPA